MDSQFANEIARTCLDHYQSLPRKGKPIPNAEWTLLSSIVMTLDGEFTVVAMATGTKCLGHNKMSPRGDLVNDSHAEVLTRRCFIRYMYDQITTFKQTGSSDIIIGCNDREQFEVNPKINFHFYSSHVPCGDASIILKLKNEQEKRKSESVNSKIKRTKLDPEFRLGDMSKSSTKKDCQKTLENNDEDLRDKYQSVLSEDLSLCSNPSCADEDLRTVPLEKQITDEDLRICKFDIYKCRDIPPQNKKTDEDLRIPKKNQENLNQCLQKCYDEDLRFSSRVVEEMKIPVKHTEDQDDRKLSEYRHENINELDEDFRVINSKSSSIISDEDLRLCDEDMRNFFYKERDDLRYISKEQLQDCVGKVLDIHRTGAKCVAGEDRKDHKLPGVLYHTVGAVRTKPGRGDPTLSVSCSDKLARWIACGLQEMRHLNNVTLMVG